MTVEANRKLTQTYLTALGAMDAATLAELHSPDVVFEMLGTTAVSGRFEGRDDCLGRVFPPVVGALVPGTFSFAREAVVAVVDDRGAVAVTLSDGDTVSGGRYEQVYFLALTIEDGRIVKLDAAYDTAHVQEAIFGDRLAEPRPRRDFQLPADLGPVGPGTAALDVVHDYYGALAARDMQAFAALHAPDVVFDLPGSTPVSGHFEGIEACMGGVVQPFLSTFDPEQARFGERYRILCSDANRVAALMRGGGPTISGSVADVIFVQIFTVENGRIVHLHEHLDTAHIEDACFANPLRGTRATTSGGLDV